MIDIHNCILSILIASDYFWSVTSQTDEPLTGDLYFTVLFLVCTCPFVTIACQVPCPKNLSSLEAEFFENDLENIMTSPLEDEFSRKKFTFVGTG